MPNATRFLTKLLEKMLKTKVQPRLVIETPKNGQYYDVTGSAVPIEYQINWSTLLVDGSLKVLLDQMDVSSQFTIDHESLKATAVLSVVHSGSILNHTLEVSGNFMSKLLPLQFINLNASCSFATIWN